MHRGVCSAQPQPRGFRLGDRRENMSRIGIAEVETGMELSSDVRDKNGRHLISSGTVLTDKHVRALKIWGIHRVDVANGDDDRPL